MVFIPEAEDNEEGRNERDEARHDTNTDLFNTQGDDANVDAIGHCLGNLLVPTDVIETHP